MSKDVLREEIIWAKVIPEIEKHIAKFDAEFQREWEARVGLKVTRQSHKGTDPSEETSTAKAALDKLVELGCEREKILCLLYMYVGGDPKKVGAVKKAFAWQRKHLLSTAQALNNTA